MAVFTPGTEPPAGSRHPPEHLLAAFTDRVCRGGVGAWVIHPTRATAPRSAVVTFLPLPDRAMGWGCLAHGRHEEKVYLIELGVDERRPILSAFPIEAPHGTQFFERVHGIKPTPDGFASLADRCSVFRVEAFTEH